MSKEKQCECCHEWWYASDIKQDLCPNCYDYFKQLKQLLKEAQTRISELEDKDWFEATIRQLEEQNDRLIQERDSLKQQLDEYKNKENTSAVNSWDEMLKNCESCGLNECIGCEYTQTCVQNIKQQLAEKDKRIAELEQELSELKTKYEDCENERLQNRIEYLTMKNKWLSTEKELAELKEKAIMPRFKRQEIVYCFSYGKIQLFNVVAYFDNQITLCENRETGKLEFVDNNYLCLTEQEAQAKLKEMNGNV